MSQIGMCMCVCVCVCVCVCCFQKLTLYLIVHGSSSTIINLLFRGSKPYFVIHCENDILCKLLYWLNKWMIFFLHTCNFYRPGCE